MKYAVDRGVWFTSNTSSSRSRSFTEANKAKQKAVLQDTEHFFEMAKKHNAKLTFGTDLVVGADASLQTEELAARSRWFTPFEILQQATSRAGELIALAGPRNPYPGTLGVIEAGAYADVLLVNGNPLDDISILTRPEETLALIMKDGTIYKNTADDRPRRAV